MRAWRRWASSRWSWARRSSVRARRNQRSQSSCTQSVQARAFIRCSGRWRSACRCCRSCAS
eukprot:1877978-Rhodomonas_salina.1